VSGAFDLIFGNWGDGVWVLLAFYLRLGMRMQE
jgi:hypothetical protein